jgi:uncharacterized protein YjiS (DUF1127 family)
MTSPITYDKTTTGFGLLSNRGTSIASRFQAWRERRRQINRITFELNSYTDRELADLGLGRGDIDQVARGTFRRG